MIFNEIWQADMKSNGVLPLIKGINEEQKNADTGYVIVDMNPMPEPDSSARASEQKEIFIFKEVVIPAGKQRSYDLFKKLHDKTTSTETAEINEFLEFAANTPPMRLARKYAEDNHQLKAGCSMEEWIYFLKSIWFEFDTSKGNGICYFDHVFFGEQGGKRDNLGGHQFWYHYYVNNGQSQILKKDIGGFFVGTSAEGLMAMGTVAHLDGREHIPAQFNGESIDLTVPV